MRILITGGNGQLGTELRNLLDHQNIVYTSKDSNNLDITNKEEVEKYFREETPQLVYHCAAYTNVDGAEDEPGKSVNYNVNVEGTQNVANAAEMVGATLVYISTDYVFDGNNANMYVEEDIANPQNEYGRAKLAGENIVSNTVTKYYIVRTSWVFGEFGKNFVYTMLNLAKSHDELDVVNDQIGRPTWTKTLAEFMVYLVDHKVEYGLYQLSNDGSCSWYDFARMILKDKTIKLNPVDSNAFKTKAYRPKHSVMNLDKAKNTGFKIISWQDALKKFELEVNNG